MSQSIQSPAQNRLLAALPASDRRRFIERCELVNLTVADALYEPRAPIRHVYFPTTSFVSLITPGLGHDRMEVGLVGDEGMLGASLVLGVGRASLLARVQGAGAAWQMDAKSFREALDHGGALKPVLQRYIHVVMCQLAQSAVCTRFHVVEARVARWLLMSRDRAHSNEFHVTHEFMASVLGVRRAGVTRAASALHARNLIRYTRGDVRILDRRGLETATCGCYAVDRQTYAAIMT